MTYQTIDTIFLSSELVSSAAEAHGLATGMFCLNNQAQGGVWLKQLFDDDTALNAQQTRILLHLFEKTKESLTKDDYNFEPLLPEDETPLSTRIKALSDWCQGFLFGVGGLYQAGEQSAQAHEILRDIAEFTKLDSDAEGEENEVAFMEVTEYLRTAVLLLRAEFGSSGRTRIH
ncbi:MAG: UPF0149 family protein [Gammaproteobacteria bacterium]